MEARETRRDAAFLGGNYAATRRVRLLARRNARDITFWLSLKEGGGGKGGGGERKRRRSAGVPRIYPGV